MKRIEAIIRKTKFEDVKDALYDAGVTFFSYWDVTGIGNEKKGHCLLYTSPSPRDAHESRMPSSA